MCNAANHRAGCDCGWGQGTEQVFATTSRRHSGGKGGAYGGYLKSEYTGSDSMRWSTCPYCSLPVYFVRHNGGSVWLDELGPPWPIHGCFSERTRSDPRLVLTRELREHFSEVRKTGLHLIPHTRLRNLEARWLLDAKATSSDQTGSIATKRQTKPLFYPPPEVNLAAAQAQVHFTEKDAFVQRLSDSRLYDLLGNTGYLLRQSGYVNGSYLPQRLLRKLENCGRARTRDNPKSRSPRHDWFPPGEY